jgi:homocysteine S-methyltransferase
MDLQAGRPAFLSYIKQHIVIGDGAMATLLHQYGIPARTCYEELCVTNPGLVADVHRAYVAAGAILIQTNTFNASRAGLSRYGLHDSVEAINRIAVRVAKDAVEGKAYVFGTIGSIADLLKHDGLSERERNALLMAQYQDQAAALLAEEVDGLLLETFPDLFDMLIALRAVRELTDLPIIANLAPEAIGYTRDGVPVSEAFDQMVEFGANIVGLNCRLGPSGILRTYEQVERRADVIYGAVPNGGMLHLDEGRVVYTGNPSYFADVASQLEAWGVRFLGGCCGTTPEHIKAMKDKIEARISKCASGKDNAGQEVDADARDQLELNTRTETTDTRKEMGIDDCSDTRDAVKAGPDIEVLDDIGRGRGTVTVSGITPLTEEIHPTQGTVNLVDMVRHRPTVIVELDPPKTLDCTKFLAGARALHAAGADFVTLADNSLGMVRVSNMALASMLKAIGIEPLVHIACRDRNLIGQQSHLMGLHVLGIHHILLVTGDPSRFGDLPGATSVYDVSSIELTKMVSRLNAGIAFSGQVLKHPSRFILGTAFNPNVHNFDKAIQRLRSKIEAGAHYVMTQPIFDVRMFERIAKATLDLGVPIFVGIMPVTSERNARFLHNEVPGIRIPLDVMQRISQTAPESVREVGLQIAEELIDEALKYFNGIYLITPFLMYDMTVRLTRYVHERTVTEASTKAVL